MSCRLILVLLLACSTVTVGCEQPAATALNVRSLPEYKGREVERFDDSVEPYAVGLSIDKINLKRDQRFRERATVATGIARMKITTVTLAEGAARTGVLVSLERVGNKLGGTDESASLDLTIAETAPGYLVFKQLGTKGSGRTVIVLWKKFRVGDEAVVHFYIAPDDQDTLDAVRDSVALQELSGK